MELKKIDTEKVKPDEVVGKLSDDDYRLMKRAENKIAATRANMEHLNDIIAKEYLVINKVWDNYKYPREIRKKLSERGLHLCMNTETKEVYLSETTDKEMHNALMHRLLW